MPWVPSDAPQHTHRANTPRLQELWAKVANESLGRGDPEAVAIRKANAVVKEQADAEADVHRGRHRWL